MCCISVFYQIYVSCVSTLHNVYIVFIMSKNVKCVYMYSTCYAMCLLFFNMLHNGFVVLFRVMLYVNIQCVYYIITYYPND